MTENLPEIFDFLLGNFFVAVNQRSEFLSAPSFQRADFFKSVAMVKHKRLTRAALSLQPGINALAV